MRTFSTLGRSAGPLVAVTLGLTVDLGVPATATGQQIPTAQATNSTPRPMRVEDMFRFASVGSVAVSPDGRRVAYVVSTRDLEENDGRSDVWMLELPDGEPRRMTGEASSASAPAFSPDGRWLTFLATRGDDAERQVWGMDLRGGEAQPLTRIDRGVSDYAWAPDSERLAVLLRDPEPERDDGSPRPPWVVDRLQFKSDYQGYLDRRRSHVYVYRLDRGPSSADAPDTDSLGADALVEVTSGDFDNGAIAWSPDGRRVAFVSNRTTEPDENYDTDVWVVDAGPATEPIRVSRSTGTDGSPAWSPDGTRLVWTTTLRPEIGGYSMTYLAVGTLGGEPLVVGASLDRSLSSPGFSADGSRILALLERDGTQSLVAFGLDGAGPDTLLGGRRRVESFVPVPTPPGATPAVPAGSLVVEASTHDRPSELWLLEPSGATHRLTSHNDALMAELRLGPVTSEWLQAPDGTRLEAFYTFPPATASSASASTVGAPADVDPLPTILWIHGGPMGQDDWGWSALRHLFAAHGYLVVQPNYRGSHGYGQEFALGLWQDWGGPESMDAIASVDHAIERGWADPDRLGVGGWSYGGITTNAIITKTDRFAAAMSGAGASLHTASWGHDHYQRWYRQELGLPWENRELWERISPFYQVDRITTPTLWMGGEHDWNVPILQAEIMYQSMRALGRETLLVVYPGQHHGGFPPAYDADRYRRWLGWFGRYLGGDDDMWPGEWPVTLRR